MLNLNTVEALIGNLKSRIDEYPDNNEYSIGYKDALNDCLYDIRIAFDDTISQEMLETMPTEELLNLFAEQFKSTEY